MSSSETIAGRGGELKWKKTFESLDPLPPWPMTPRELTAAFNCLADEVRALRGNQSGDVTGTIKGLEIQVGALTQGLTEMYHRLIPRNYVGERLRKVASGYMSGGHSHRAKMLNALANEFDPKPEPELVPAAGRRKARRSR